MISEPHYHKLTEPHRRALNKLELEFDFFLKDIGEIDIYGISSRTKTYKSAIRKSKERKIDLKDLDDLAGMRIIVGTKNEIPIIERFFSRQEFGNDLEVLKRHDLNKNDGYRALHLVVEVRAHYQRSLYPGRVEIQLQTVLAHAFNFLSRSWKYKQAWKSSEEWDQQFIQMSQALSSVENIAASLHAQLVNKIADAPNSPLTPHSFIQISLQEFGEDVTLADAVDNCRMYANIGYDTNDKLRSFFKNPDIQKLYSLVEENHTHPTMRHLAAMGKTGFWNMFGTRISTPGIQEFLESFFKS